LLLVEPGTTREATPLHERLLQGIGERMWGRYVRTTAAGVVALDPVAHQHALDDGFGEDRIHLLSTGVDLERWKPGAAGSAMSRFGIRGRALVHVGPLETSHGLEELIAAFAATVGQRNDWSLVLAGNGSGRRGLRTTAERLGIAARIHWLHDVDEDELPSLLSASTLFVAPALDDSPLIRPVLRALACGLPVLASDTDRYRWAVQNNESGLVVPMEGKPAWEKALTRASTSPKARERWSIGARQWAEGNLDWKNIAQAFERMMYKAREMVEEEEEKAAS
ncbi:MAG: glycosyltransferase involved in cell wall biosynthesis, partial [Planctomycetota bacterium]